jgi:glycosyltransferase involved in cell wall biosynthesis
MRVAIDIRRAGDYGVGTYIRNIVGQLARLDGAAQYLLIGSQRNLEELGPLPPNFQLLPHEFPPGSRKSFLRLPFLLRRHRVELYHVPWFMPLALWLTPCPFLLTVHDLTTLLYSPARTAATRAAQLWFARRSLECASRILAVSHTAKRELARAFQLPESKIDVIYNAVDERFTREPVPADADRILERHAVNFPYVLYAGNIKPHKNLVRLIEAFAVAKAELGGFAGLDKLRLLVIGDELTAHPDLRRAVVRTRVREDVRFLGFVPHPVLRVFYARARAFLFPSLYEGFGLPPLEAMAHGTPVLTSNVSSLPEVFGEAALLVNPENVFDIARGIRQILTEQVLRETLIKRGYDLVKKYSWARSGEKVREAYAAVAAQGA